MNQNVEILNETSSMSTYRVKAKQTVKTLLSRLALKEKYFAVLVNGEKADLSHVIEVGDEILVLPRIAGG